MRPGWTGRAVISGAEAGAVTFRTRPPCATHRGRPHGRSRYSPAGKRTPSTGRLQGLQARPPG